MSLQLPFGVRVLNPAPVDDKYLNGGVPYTSVEEVNNAIGSGIRHIGLTVNINNEEYWYKSGIADVDLVRKVIDVAETGAVTGATNGITKDGSVVKLGGELTGDTTILGANNSLIIGDEAGTSALSNFEVNAYDSIFMAAAGTGSTDYWGGFSTDDSSTKLSAIKEDGEFGPTDLSIHIEGEDVGLRWTTGEPISRLTVNGYGLDYWGNVGDINLWTTGTFNLKADGGYIDTPDGLNYQDDYSPNFTKHTLVDVNYVTGLTSNIEANAITTASNGLTKVGNDVQLGGLATGNIVISGDSTSTLALGLSDHPIGWTEIYSNGIHLEDGFNNILNLGASGITVTLGGNNTFKYNANYSANFTARSLVDKEYVDNLAAGLDPKEAVKVATTAPLAGATYNPNGGVSGTGSFSSAPTEVDGYSVANGDRILVKNQADAKQNGVYVVVSSGEWQRASDMDGTPAHEVSTGNFVFVTTGNTNTASGWVVIGSGDTLSLNVDEIVWAQFSASVTAYQPGNGIDIVGTTISVDLAANGGLEFSGEELQIATSIAGDGLDYNSGVLSLDANVAGDGLEYNGGVINISSEILNGVHTANNGLTKSGTNVRLGGELTGDTTILGANKELALGDAGVSGLKNFIVATYDSIDIRTYSTGSTDYWGGLTSDSFETKLLVYKEDGQSGPTDLSVHIEGEDVGLRWTTGEPISVLTVNGDGLHYWGNVGDINLWTTGTFNLNADGGYIDTPDGLNYQDDYSANFTKHTLVDVNYVTGLTTTSGVQTANNGLTKNGTNVQLGGSLTGDTLISGANKELTFGDGDVSGLKMFNVAAYDSIDISTYGTGSTDYWGGFSADGSSTKLSAYYENGQSGPTDLSIHIEGEDVGLRWNAGEPISRLTVNGNGLDYWGNTGDINLWTTGTFNLNADGGYIDTPDGLNYQDDYSANFTKHTLVDVNYVTGLTSSIKVNKLTVGSVTGNTTLTDSDHVVLVNTSVSALTITLPASPVDGQVYHIKDKSGNAFANSITISGNGNNIDGGASALINTDHGSLYIVFSEADSEWYTLAFIN